ncbi:DUF5682 family protein [Roseateles chitosanitabidus]|uniref:DUF5682 family protein n=1 Tax=Roseateles chitosanitabidus TaxID=65048 RepID=UPI000834F7FF|nr:DUF5682 family protein [Roseateles chitosanitabidus]
MTDPVHFFGVRHHGPGCARSLLTAFEALRPDCVLIEGPPEADGLVAAVLDPEMAPPVALLTHGVEDAGRAVYHPFATFSPEWQALRWAAAAGVPVRFIDLPVAISLGLEAASREEAASESRNATPPKPPLEQRDGPAEDADDALPVVAGEASTRRGDPLDWFARAAGYADGEAWWNHMVEERGDGEDLFLAIAEAMTTLRAEAAASGEDETLDPRTPRARREAMREAHMRQCIRAARKEGFARIAVVCGAWHLGGLQADVAVKSDQALLKGAPKLKVTSTWVPWTYRHLARESGYGAGIASPGWYEHLWRSAQDGESRPRAIGWLARVARLMRERDLDCSSAHLIEAARLADTLAALRQRPAPGLDELHEATRTVMTLGDDAVSSFIRDELVIGDRLGRVPASVPMVPLQRDLEQLQKSLRMKPEATQKTLDLDLRQPNDLARSHLLHRLRLIDLPWGEIARAGKSSRGTFHEVWSLQWQPEYALRLIEASRWGQSVAQAATVAVAERCGGERTLGALAELVDRVLLADLPDAVAVASRALQDHAAVTGDADQLLAALPPLANVFRYGNVRQTDAALVGQVFDGLVTRAAIGLPLAGDSLDDAAAAQCRDRVLGAQSAIRLRDPGRQTEPSTHWRAAIAQLAAREGAHALLRGLCTRLLLDDGLITAEEAGTAISLHLSRAAEPAKAAAWLDGFLNRNAVVLLHHDGVWPLVDAWLSGLDEEHFIRVLPLVRRTFAHFGPGERRDLGQRAARKPGVGAVSAASAEWDETRAALPLPLLRAMLGVTA